MNINEVRKYIVIVNGGSGVIFQAADPEFTYILTAKHVLEGEEKLDVVRFLKHGETWNELVVDSSDIIVRDNYFPHENKDIAIIKVAKIDKLDNILRLDNIEDPNEKYYLMGYPKKRRDDSPDCKEKWFRDDRNVEIHDSRGNGRREAQLPDRMDWEEVNGHSGGGIVKFASDTNLFLAGIQNKMSSEREDLGRVEFTPIKYFDEIVERNQDKLKNLYPPYMECFSFLKDEAFDLHAGFSQENIENTKNLLKHKCLDVIDSHITPLVIKRLFKERILIDDEKNNEMENKIIWVLWLEFLTIINIAFEKVHSNSELLDIFNNHRLLCSSTQKDWCCELKNLMYADYKGLSENAVVIVGVKESPEDGEYEINNLLPSIAYVRDNRDRDKMRIDRGMNFPFEDFKFVHIDYFKKGTIVENHSEFADLGTDKQILNKLREEYEKAFRRT